MIGKRVCRARYLSEDRGTKRHQHRGQRGRRGLQGGERLEVVKVYSEQDVTDDEHPPRAHSEHTSTGEQQL